MPIALAVTVPTALAVLIGVVINSRTLNRLSLNFDRGFAEMDRHLEDVKQSLLEDLLRFERVIDARLKRLEERKFR